MTDFVTNNTTLDFPKSNLYGVPGGGDATKYLTGASWNDVCQAAYDLRTVLNTYRKVFNVLEPAYGAKGDGVTNDTAAVQSAITAASVAGGTVYFPATANGYLFNSGLTIQADNVFLTGDPGRSTLLKWGGAYTGVCIAISHGTVQQHRFNTGVRSFRIEPQNVAATCIQTTRVYGCFLDDLAMDAFGTASGTGYGIQMVWGTDAVLDYSTGHRIRNCNIIGFLNGIRATGAHPELVTNSNVSDCFIYGEAQANSTGIGDLYDGSTIVANEIEGHKYGVYLNNQGCSLLGNRFETNTTGSIYFDTSAYNNTAVGNKYANSPRSVFASSASQRQNYVIDGDIAEDAQLPENINRACHVSTGIGPVDKWYTYGESSTPGFWQQLSGTTPGGTNPFGETVSTRELAVAAGDVLMKIGTIANRALSLYINSLATLTLARGTGENTLTADQTFTAKTSSADGATAVAMAVDTSTTWSTSGAKLLSIRTNGSEKASIDKAGAIVGGSLQSGSSGTGTTTTGTITAGGTLSIRGNVASNGTSTPIKVFNSVTLTTAGDIIAAFYSDSTASTKQLVIDKDGIIIHNQAANSTGTPGAATANVAAGRSALAAGTGAAGIVITNGLVTATSRVYCQIQTHDGTATSIQAVPAAGSFTVYTNANTTGITNFCWEVFN